MLEIIEIFPILNLKSLLIHKSKMVHDIHHDTINRYFNIHNYKGQHFSSFNTNILLIQHFKLVLIWHFQSWLHYQDDQYCWGTSISYFHVC